MPPESAQSPPPRSTRTNAQLLTVLSLCVLSIFTLPYLVPVPGNISDSSIFGFSNRTALVLLLGLTLAYGLWARGLGLHLPVVGDVESRFSRRPVYLLLAFVAVVTLAMYLWTRPFLTFGEATYFLDRYENYRLGAKLYRDFEFPYGPLMFYPPIWVAKLFHLTYGDGYFLCWIAQWIAGAVCMGETLRLATQHTRHRTAIFVLITLPFLMALLDGGSNYQPLRFFSCLLLALHVHRLYAAGQPLWKPFSLAAAGTVVLLFYSPDYGIAFAVGTFLFFLISVRRTLPGKYLALALYGLAVMLALVLAGRIGLFDSMRNFSAGALNLPLLLGPHTLFLLTMLMGVGCIVVAAFRQGVPDHRLVYLIAIALPLTPSAMSRCDWGHIYINAMGAMIALLVVFSQYPRLWHWSSRTLLVLAILGIGMKVYTSRNVVLNPLRQIAFSAQGEHPVLQRIYTKALFLGLGKERAQRKLMEQQIERVRLASSAQDLAPGTRLFAPFGIPRRVTGEPGGLEISSGRYFTYFELPNEQGPELKVAELRQHPQWPIVVPLDLDTGCTQQVQQVRHSLALLFLTPLVPQPRKPYLLATLLCTYIETNYVPSPAPSPYPQTRFWTPTLRP